MARSATTDATAITSTALIGRRRAAITVMAAASDLGQAFCQRHRCDDGGEDGGRHRIERDLDARRDPRKSRQDEMPADAHRVGAEAERDDQEKRQGLAHDASFAPARTTAATMPATAPVAKCQGDPTVR